MLDPCEFHAKHPFFPALFCKVVLNAQPFVWIAVYVSCSHICNTNSLVNQQLLLRNECKKLTLLQFLAHTVLRL